MKVGDSVDWDVFSGVLVLGLIEKLVANSEKVMIGELNLKVWYEVNSKNDISVSKYAKYEVDVTYDDSIGWDVDRYVYADIDRNVDGEV